MWSVSHVVSGTSCNDISGKSWIDRSDIKSFVVVFKLKLLFISFTSQHAPPPKKNPGSAPVYNASIKPLFTYFCIVWSNCSQTNSDKLFKLQKRCARLILYSPRDTRSYDNFQKLKWLPVDQLFKLNKLGLLKKVIDGRAPEYLITTLDSLRFEHKYSTRTKPLYRLPKPRTEAMRRTFFYSTIKELNALNLEPTTSFSLMKATLTNNVASNYTVDNFKVKKLFWFLKIRAFF